MGQEDIGLSNIVQATATYGIKYMFATTWSNPRATKMKIGIQSAIIFEATSLAPAKQLKKEKHNQTFGVGFSYLPPRNRWKPTGLPNCQTY